MSVPLSAYAAALPDLQAKYDALKIGTYTLKIEPISGTDIYYSDGDARSYKGKISLFDPAKGYSDFQIFFTDDGLTHNRRSSSDDVFQTWIITTAHQYRESQQS
jgi:hypothetical protein